MKSMQLRPSAIEVAKLYLDVMGTFVMDNVDRKFAAEVEALGLHAVVTNTVMTGMQQRKALARVVARSLGKVGTKA
jgi:hypothetical protein